MDLLEKRFVSLKAKEIIKNESYPKPNDLIVSNWKNKSLNVEKFLKDLQLAAKN